MAKKSLKGMDLNIASGAAGRRQRRTNGRVGERGEGAKGLRNN